MLFRKTQYFWGRGAVIELGQSLDGQQTTFFVRPDGYLNKIIVKNAVNACIWMVIFQNTIHV